MNTGALTMVLSLERSSSAASGLANAPTWRYMPPLALGALLLAICTGTTAAACCCAGGVHCSTLPVLAGSAWVWATCGSLSTNGAC
ncbi:hypothetical protein D3C80_1829220 [compost metagenome]